MKILDIGKTNYEDALKLQKSLFDQKVKDPCSEDIILITEHYPVYTLGKTSKEEHIINIPENIPVYKIERGGSITFHGEGQIVVYPVVHLKGKKRSVRNFIWTLEEIMIRTVQEFGINGFRLDRYRGVFTPKGKIGFVGIKVSRSISYHGISLNVNVDKIFFRKIVPCGIKDIPVCNMSDFVGDVDLENVKQILIKNIKQLL
ncbi:lipoyl(octanoyl) transferase LipB [Persephonella sp.]|uniref:lipoyl(octanoyl) transferase LipB n=1 Tax=Persephonella sp. TaxID=2060922 RepID=UPI00261ED761|nr:lipoyl(octanoyl) transferase LipB [Persephonella sp.]